MARINQLLKMLPEADRENLLRHSRTTALRHGDVLAEPGDDIRNVYFPDSGIVSFVVELRDGSLVQTSMVGCDGVIGAAQAIDGKKSINKIIVQVPGSAHVLDRDPLRDILRRGSEIARLFASHDQFFIADIQQTAACNAHHRTEARMARWLLRMRDLVGDDLPITQEYLAAMIGVTRTTVTELASAMQDAGIITYVRGSLHITNAEALKAHACECYEAVLENYESLMGTPWHAVVASART